MERTLMQTDNKAFYDLVGQEFQVVKLPQFKLIEITHRVENKEVMANKKPQGISLRSFNESFVINSLSGKNSFQLVS